jgi:alkanesulfonate monooxygenase SsuD/methylene tetrahydromethanopterin reductase-like flavin-dependent oxidoreductase (luciferase family)
MSICLWTPTPEHMDRTLKAVRMQAERYAHDPEGFILHAARVLAYTQAEASFYAKFTTPEYILKRRTP